MLKALPVAAVICALGVTWGLANDRSTSQREAIQGLLKLADICERQDCGGSVKKISVNVAGRMHPGVEIKTPTGVQQFFELRDSERGVSIQICWCVDCVSTSYSFKCQVL